MILSKFPVLRCCYNSKIKDIDELIKYSRQLRIFVMYWVLQYPENNCDSLEKIEELYFLSDVNYNRSNFKEVVKNIGLDIKIVRKITPKTHVVYKKDPDPELVKYNDHYYMIPKIFSLPKGLKKSDKLILNYRLEQTKKVLSKIPKNHTKFICIDVLDELVRDKNCFDISMNFDSFMDIVNKLSSKDPQIKNLAYKTIISIPTKYKNSIKLLLSLEKSIPRKQPPPKEFRSVYSLRKQINMSCDLRDFEIEETFEEDMNNIYKFFETDLARNFFRMPDFCKINTSPRLPAQRIQQDSIIKWDIS